MLYRKIKVIGFVDWEPAINELQLTYIGNQRWLYRKDLDRILEEFNKLLDFSRDKAEFLYL